MSYTLSEVMDLSAALLNDAAKSDYTYAVQLPCLKIALNELQEEFELNNVPMTNEDSAPITVTAGTTFLDLSDLPDDLVEIQQLWERPSGTTDSFVPMTKVEFLPHYLDGQQVSNLIYWAWEAQQIKFIGATLDTDVKLDYISSIFPISPDENSTISVINTMTFLVYRNAALNCEFRGENPSRAQALNQNVVLALDRAIGIPTKGRQSIATRRRPFRASYRSRQVW